MDTPEPTALNQAFAEESGHSESTGSNMITSIRGLFSKINQLPSEHFINLAHNEEHIRRAFVDFLSQHDFQMAIKDFEALLNEGGMKTRNDGTTSYYHQLSNVLMLLALVEGEYISVEQLEEFGGIETAVRTALRHDSVEDTALGLEGFIRQIDGYVDGLNFTSERQGLEFSNNAILLQNVDLLSKTTPQLDSDRKVERDPDTDKIIKRNRFRSTRSYTFNMLAPQDTVLTDKNSAVVWIVKLGDGSHNLSTMLGAEKFTAPRRYKYTKERIRMFGSMHGFSETAKDKWPEFADAIDVMDNLMGAVAYGNLGYLVYVDLFEAHDEEGFQEGDRIYKLGIKKYLDQAMNLNIPMAFHPFHIWLERVNDIASDHSDPEIRLRAYNFLKHSVLPALEGHKKYFPRIFPANDDIGSGCDMTAT